MEAFKKGSFCRSVAGHDFGTVYIVVETGNLLKVADGKYKGLSKPKKKNPGHLELLDYRDPAIDEKIAVGKLQDTDLKYSIKNYLKTHYKMKEV